VTTETDKQLSLQRYRAAWRWHFYAGLVVLPFLLTLALTGLVMVYYSAVETPAGPSLNIAEGPGRQPAADLLQTAQQAVPGGDATQYIPATTPGGSAQFVFDTPTGPRQLDLDPYRNEVLRNVLTDQTVYAWAHRIHGTLLLGDVGDFIVETAAGLALLMVVTGLYMWCLRRKPGTGAESRRRRWRGLHLTTGVYAALGLCFFILSGLAWTNIWGGKLVQAWGSFPAEKWGPVELSQAPHAAMNHGSTKDVPWGLEQTPMPESHGHRNTATQQPQTLTEIEQRALALGFGPRYRINLPRDPQGVYTLSANSMSGDIDSPGQERTVHLDQYSGELLAEATFADYSLLAKSMALGVGLHQGSMGWWNSLLNAAACLVVIVLCISGIVMWWLRRPARTGALAPPPRAMGLPSRNSLTLILVLCALAFPLLGLALTAGWLIDRLLLLAQPA